MRCHQGESVLARHGSGEEQAVCSLDAQPLQAAAGQARAAQFVTGGGGSEATGVASSGRCQRSFHSPPTYSRSSIWPSSGPSRLSASSLKRRATSQVC